MKTPVPRRLWRSCGLAALALSLPSVHAVILYNSGNPAVNTTAPTGPLQDSGWQYANAFLGFNGYPISPDSFVVSKHIVGGYHQGVTGGATFTYLGVNYTSVARYDEPNGGDLTVLKIDPLAAPGAFPSFVPLYRKNDEVGKDFVVLGRGVERGTQVDIASNGTTAASPNLTLRGWKAGGNPGTQRWGENQVDSILTSTGPNPQYEFLYSTFTPPSAGGLVNEAALAGGDSSGGVFIKDTDGIWKLAGLNSGVDSIFSTTSNGTAVLMALIDAGGLYDGANPLQDTTNLDLAFGPDHQVSNLPPEQLFNLAGSHLVGGYHTRISNLSPWLDSVSVPESSTPTAVFGTALLAAACWTSRRK